MEKKNLFEIIKNLGKKSKIAILVGVGIVVLTVICGVIFAPSGETSFSAETSLKEVFKNSQISTSEYTYESIATVLIKEDQPAKEDNIKYYVSYKGIVKMGVDFAKIDVVDDKEGITVIIPKIEIQTTDIDTDLDYIFTKKKYDTEKTYQEALNACRKDLEKKAKNNNTLYTTAIDSAVATVTALTKPFEKYLEEGKTIKVVYIDHYGKESK